MGKKSYKQKNKGQNKGQQKDQEQKDGEPKVQKKVKVDRYVEKNEDFFVNPIMSTYYKTVLKPDFKDDKEFDDFWNIMKESLPVTFRVSPNVPNYETYWKKLMRGKEYLNEIVQEDYERIKEEHIQMKLKEEQQNKMEEERQKEENQEIQDKEDKSKEQKIEEQKKKYLVSVDKEIISQIDSINLQNIPCIPDNLAFQLGVSKEQLKRGRVLKKFHRELTSATDSGLVTRQELVSMLPPLLLDPQPTDIIFDMCAAPGSKTSQILESMYYKAKKPEDVTGCVVANDKDLKRAFMLSHQMNRASLTGSMICNHEAQFFPSLQLPKQHQTEKYDQKLYFDKVLADVPCTGDGATRKILKKFVDWSCRDALGLFPIQLQILVRALQMVKVGGIVVYSTCSINPIEDEAIVVEALRRAVPGSLELLDCHKRIPNIKGRKGLTHWPVLINKLRKKYLEDQSAEGLQKLTFEEMFEEIKKEDVGNFTTEQLTSDSTYSQLKKQMFPESEEVMKKLGIEKTMRLLPHDQNTGGFYLALFRKKTRTVFTQNQPFDPSKIVESTEGQEEELQKDSQKEEEVNEDEKQIVQDVVEKMMSRQERLIIKHGGEDPAYKFDNNKKNKATEEKVEEEEEEQQQQKKEGEKVEVEEEEKKEIEQDKPIQKKKKKANDIYETYEEVTEDIYNQLVQNYGIKDLQRDQLMQHVRGNNNIIRFITKGVRKIYDANRNGQLKLVNLGQKAFKRENNKDGQFPYRLSNDGIQSIFPYLNKRTMKVTKEQFKFLVDKNQIKLDQMEDKEFLKQIKDFGTGSLAVYTEVNGRTDCLVAQIFGNSINTMISGEAKQGLKMLYQ